MMDNRKSLYTCTLRRFVRFTRRFTIHFLDTPTGELHIRSRLARLTSNPVDASPNAGVPPSGVCRVSNLKSQIPAPSLRAHPLPSPSHTSATNLSRNLPVSRRPVLILLYTIEGRKPRGRQNFVGVPRRALPTKDTALKYSLRKG